MHRITNIDYLQNLESTTKLIRETTNRITGSESVDRISTGTKLNEEFDPNNTAIGAQNNTMNVVPLVTILIGIGVAIPIVLLVIVVMVTLVLLYLRKSKSKSCYNDSYATLRRGETQQLQPHSQRSPIDTDLYDQIQLSPSTGQSEMVSTTEIENINIPSLQQPRVSPNTDTDQGDKISGEDDVSTSEQPTYIVAVKKKQKKNKHLKGKNFSKNASSSEKNKEEIMLHSAIKVKKRETTPTSVDTTESLEALYSVVQKKPKADRDKEEKVPPPPPYSVEEMYTAVRKNAKGSAMEEEAGAPQIPSHTIEDLYTAVMKKPKGDSIDGGTDGAPPIPPYTVDDC